MHTTKTKFESHQSYIHAPGANLLQLIGGSRAHRLLLLTSRTSADERNFDSASFPLLCMRACVRACDGALCDGACVHACDRAYVVRRASSELCRSACLGYVGERVEYVVESRHWLGCSTPSHPHQIFELIKDRKDG